MSIHSPALFKGWTQFNLLGVVFKALCDMTTLPHHGSFPLTSAT